MSNGRIFDEVSTLKLVYLETQIFKTGLVK